MVNVREHCSWCTDSKEEATEKAKILVKSGIERVKRLEPVPIKTVPVTKATLVIGGGIGGQGGHRASETPVAAQPVARPRRRVHGVAAADRGAAPDLRLADQR